MNRGDFHDSDFVQWLNPALTERERIDALYRYRILDTAPEKPFDNITLLATQIFNVPVSLISFVDAERIWFKSKQGLNVDQIDAEPGFCASAIASHQPYIVHDARSDPRTQHNPLVLGETGLRFYAGIPLHSSDGMNIGVLSVIDFKPQAFSPEQVKQLQSLANIVMHLLELNLSIDVLDKIHQADNKFRLTFEKLADPMLLLDPASGHFIDWNPAALKMLGFPNKAEVKILRPVDISPDRQPDGRDSAGKAIEMIETALKNGSHRFEWTICSPYRKAVPIEVLLTVIQMDTRPIFVTTWRDLTLYKQAEAELLESELLWKFALEGAGDGVWDWDIVQSKVKFSLSWKSMLGYDDHDIEDSFGQWQSLVHPGDIENALQDLNTHLQGIIPSYANEHRLLCKDGSYKWILDRGKVVRFDEAGKPLRMVGTHTDISQHKQVLDSLSALEQNNQALMAAMVDGVFIAQGQRFVFANQALPAMLGYTPEEFIGLHFDEVVDPGFLELWTTRYKQRLDPAKHPERQYEIKFLRKGGQGSLWVELIASRMIFKGEPGVLGIIRNITEKKAAETLIWNQANFDFLTGLPNRHLFLDRLSIEIKKSKRLKKNMALMFIDLDHFKEINDTMGHDAGDLLLKEAARRLQRCVRDTDMVSRLGGDEFTIILTDMDEANGVDQRAQAILKVMEEPFTINNELAYVSASIGITVYPEDTDQAEHLLKFSDQAMYHAKKLGRNRFSYYAPTMQEASVAKMHLVADIHRAIKNREFYLVCQPIVDLKSGRTYKGESLIRWNHPTRGLVNPAEFIPIAEDTGLINQIGLWVLQESIDFAHHIRVEVDPSFQISVNTSPVQYRNEDSTYPSFEKLIHENKMDSSLVVLEITESLLMDGESSINTKLYNLRDAGVEISIDDFGTGYSSLSYLKRFNINFLKIDQSFVKGMLAGSSDHALCEAMIVMAHKLGIQVIAEGVETEEQKALLLDAGCDYAQGYLFSKPLSLPAFREFLQR
jgi:diguanylate cyclase (GGDEF)-like protein/PAS domain S-box-containing protein